MWNLPGERAGSADCKLIENGEESGCGAAANSNMGIRTISSVIGIAIALLALILHNTFFFPLCAGVVSLILCFEFLRANGLLRYRVATVGALAYALALPFFSAGPRSRFRMMVTVVCFCLVLFEYVRYQTKMPAKRFFAFVAGMFLTANAMSTLVILNNSSEDHGLAYMMLALGGAWFADSGAYFVGTFFGKTPLCPAVSPKKTVEGFIGGLVTNIVYFVVFCLIYGAIFSAKGTPLKISWFSAIVLAAVCAILGTLGDLVASVIKRQAQIKDYGTIMPGHGGLLDRFDSVLLVVPFFCAYTQATSLFRFR